MQPRVSVFRWVPPFAQGIVRDLRVRWALHEAGRAYDEALIGRDDQDSAAYRLLQPFGQVPAYQDTEVQLFESGAIVLHIAQCCPKLLPTETSARSRAQTWMFAALNTVEPPIVFFNQLLLMKSDTGNAVFDATKQMATRRLKELAAWLGARSYLEDDFTAGDLLMSTVLRILRNTDLLTGFATLSAYQRRCEERPAFRAALADQLATFEAHEPPGG